MLLAPESIKRVTFRRNPYDRAVVGDPGSVIKVNGKECGVISENPCWGGNPKGDNLFTIRLQIGVENQRQWEWARAKPRFETDRAAREWLTVDRLRAMITSLAGAQCKRCNAPCTGELWVQTD